MIMGYFPTDMTETCRECKQRVWYYLKFTEISGMPVICMHCIATTFGLLSPGVSSEAMFHMVKESQGSWSLWLLRKLGIGGLPTKQSVTEIFREASLYGNYQQ